MKNWKLLAAVLGITMCSCSSTKTPQLILNNAIDIARTEVVVLNKKQVQQLVPTMSEGQAFTAIDADGTAIPYQLDDLDSDGIWDEMALVVDFDAKEQKFITVSASAKASSPQFQKYTDVHFGVGKAKPIAAEVQKYTRSYDPRDKDSLFFQMEGPAWENDKVGFRMYFDPRNGIDTFGKTTIEPTLSKQGLTTDYHTQDTWGMDILKVGTSLGAGSLAIKYQDSLYRLTGWNAARFEAIAEGPARAIFKMTYLDEFIADKSINVVHTITIEKGDWFYKSDVEIFGALDNAQIFTGIVNLKPNKAQQYITNDRTFVLESYGKQSENNDNLGMAVFLKNQLDGFPDFKADLFNPKSVNTKITDTYYVPMPVGKKSTFYFLSGWEPSDAAFKTRVGFTATVKESAMNVANPIIVTIK